MSGEMIFGIIMAVISIAAGGGAVGLSTRQNSKHKANVGRINTLETEIAVLKEKVNADNATLNEIKGDVKDLKKFMNDINLNLVKLTTTLEKEDKK